MFNSYSDAQLMNDSFVYYTSTNTFRNPAFVDGLANDQVEENSGPQGNPSIASQAKHKQGPSGDQLIRAHDDQEQIQLANEAGRFTTKQKLIDFCDSLAFSLRGKAFVMETNFKRRLRGLRRFLDERVMPWVAYAGRNELLGHSSPDMWNLEQPDWPRRASAGMRRRAEWGRSPSLGNLAANEQRLGPRRHSRQPFPSECPEPTSVRNLGAQQERILTRLERIKRDSQRLFNMQHATILESDTETEDELPPGRKVDAKGNRLAESAANRGKPLRVPIWLGGAPGAGAGGCETTTGKSLVNAEFLAQPKKTCIVCYERPANIVTLPCEHGDICSDCFIEIIYLAVKNSQYPLRCVLCRQKVERIRCSRRLMLSVIKKNRASKTGGLASGKTILSSCRMPF